jgi:hypothetical protein
MADLLNIKVDGSKGTVEGTLDDAFDIAKARRLLRDAIDDIADAVEGQVDKTVPVETGILKAHPIDRDDQVGIATGISAFGGGVSIRGAGGRFVGAAPGGTPVGEEIARTVFTLPKSPKHALFVHEGTGVYGPSKKPYFAKPPLKFMVFPRWSKAVRPDKIFRLESVRGQKPQPYLENAYLQINNVYIPARIQLLRAQIAAQT